MHGWDQSRARRLRGPYPRHTALAALAQLRAAAIRGALDGSITLPPPGPRRATAATAATAASATLSWGFPLGDAPVPDRGGQPCPAGIAPIKLSIAETIRLTVLARQHAAGLITRARLAFALRWFARRRLHQAAARWHHYSARLLAARDRVTSDGRKEVTPCNRTSETGSHAERQRRHTAENRDCDTERGRGMGHLCVLCDTCHEEHWHTMFHEPPHDIRHQMTSPG